MATRGAKPQRGRPSREMVYQRFKSVIESLESYGGLPKPIEAKGIWDGLWRIEAHNSTAIEGNTLVLKEVEKLLTEGRAVGAKELKDYLMRIFGKDGVRIKQHKYADKKYKKHTRRYGYCRGCGECGAGHPLLGDSLLELVSQVVADVKQGRLDPITGYYLEEEEVEMPF